MRLARRLAAGASVAEAAASEAIPVSVLLSVLDDPGFQELVEDFRAERDLPEDERERLLIEAAWVELLAAVDLGDTKVLLFIAYEQNRGRHPENRLRQLLSARRSAGASRGASSGCEVGEAAEAGVAGAAAFVRSGAAPVGADLDGFPQDEPGMAAPLLRPIARHPAPLGESGAGPTEPRRPLAMKA